MNTLYMNNCDDKFYNKCKTRTRQIYIEGHEYWIYIFVIAIGATGGLGCVAPQNSLIL